MHLGMTPCARCLTIQSSALPLPKYDSYIKTRNSSSVSLIPRARMGSECDMCFDKVESKINSSHTTILFPPLMQRSLFTLSFLIIYFNNKIFLKHLMKLPQLKIGYLIIFGNSVLFVILGAL